MRGIERVFERRLRKVVELAEMQISFMPGSTTNAISINRQLMENYEVDGRNLYTIFMNHKKAFDRVPREVIWWSLRKKGFWKEK